MYIYGHPPPPQDLRLTCFSLMNASYAVFVNILYQPKTLQMARNLKLLNEISHMLAINLSVCYIQILETRIRLPISYRGKSFQNEKSMNEGFLFNF